MLRNCSCSQAPAGHDSHGRAVAGAPSRRAPKRLAARQWKALNLFDAPFARVQRRLEQINAHDTDNA